MSSHKPKKAIGTADAAAVEQQIRVWLKEERWRKARDAAKDRLMSDPQRFQPLLIDANVGLALAMIREGQPENARMVIDYLRRMAPPSTIQSLERALLAGGQPAATDTLVEELNAPETPASLARRLADKAIVNFQRLDTSKDPEARSAMDLNSVLDALDAVANKNWESANAALRSIPSASPFAHWKWFVKGLIAFHLGESDRAVRCFDNLPEESVPSRAAQAYRAILLGLNTVCGDAAPSEELVADICRVVGAPKLGLPLAKAEGLWRKKQGPGSLRAFKKNVPNFPKLSTDAVGAVTNFYYNFECGEADFNESTHGQLLKELCVSDLVMDIEGSEAFLLMRLILLISGFSSHSFYDDLEQFSPLWEGFEAGCYGILGKTPTITAAIYTRRGMECLQCAELIHNALDQGHWQLLDYLDDSTECVDKWILSAENCFKTAFRTMPTFYPAYRQLLRIYTQQERDGDRKKLLQNMVQAFPDKVEVHLSFVNALLTKKGFVTAFRSLQKSLALHPRDPRLLDLMSDVCFRLIDSEASKVKRPQTKKAYEVWDSIPRASDPMNRYRSNWAIAVRKVWLCRRDGNRAAAHQEWQHALRQAPNSACPHALLFQLALDGPSSKECLSPDELFDPCFLEGVTFRLCDFSKVCLLIDKVEIFDFTTRKAYLTNYWRSWVEVAASQDFDLDDMTAFLMQPRIVACLNLGVRKQLFLRAKACIQDPFWMQIIQAILVRSDSSEKKLRSLLKEAKKSGNAVAVKVIESALDIVMFL